jgi:hypothetical protein
MTRSTDADIADANKLRDVSFMLARTLALALTDLKTVTPNAVTTEFTVHGGVGGSSLQVLYRPLILLLNGARMAPLFRSQLRSDFFVDPGNTSGGIDFERTFDTRRGGGREIEFLPAESPLSHGDITVAALLEVELAFHKRLVDEAIRDSGVDVSAQSTWSWASARFQELQADVARLVPRGPMAAGAVKAFQAEMEKAFQCLRRYVFDAGPAAVDGLADYRQRAEAVYTDTAGDVRLLSWLLDWRQEYASFQVGLGNGRQLSHAQTRSPPHLFELWSFMELAYVLATSGNEAIVQRSFLRSGAAGPTFGLLDQHQAFFNFYGHAAGALPVNLVLPRAHVEWMIVNKSSPANSVIIDTKYTKWSSEDTLKVLGYMNAFGVNRAAIVFRGPLPPELTGDDRMSNRWCLARFGDAGEKRLASLTLIPSRSELEVNQAVLRRFVQEVLLG